MTLRSLRILGPAVAGALALGACGTSSGQAETTPAPNTTPWRTLPPVSATDPTTSLAAGSGVVNYTIRVGDYANLIAKKAAGGCAGTDIMAFNPDVKILVPGQNIKIPPNCLGAGITQDLLNNGTGLPTDTTPGGTAKKATTTTTIATKYNTYVIQSGDYWYLIVKKVGCSYAELLAANASVSVLIPGNKIRVPVKCDSRPAPTTTTIKKKGK